MGLLGGGEESLTSGSSGWGVPPPSSSSPSAWGSSTSNNWTNSRQTVTSEQTISTSPKLISSWAAAAGKGLNSGPNHDLGAVANNNGFQNDNSTKNYRNDLSEIKEVALSDNWGHSVINQDSPWNLPPSPQSSPKESSASVWRGNTSASGTEIWENAVRHKTKGPAPSPVASTSSSQPWGHHTPSTHIGGTWGEDEDPNNHWTGVPQANNTNWNNQQQQQQPTNSWNNVNNNDKPRVNQSSSWENDCDQNDETDNGTSTWSGSNSGKSGGESFGTWSPVPTQRKESKSGWDNDANDRRSGNYDDGTAVWGNPTRQGKVSHWKSESAAAKQTNSANGKNTPQLGVSSMTPSAPSPGMIRLPSSSTPVNSNWPDVPVHRTDSLSSGSGWCDNDSKSVPGTPSTPGWNDSNPNSMPYWAAKAKTPTTTAPSWIPEGQIDTSSWCGPKQGKPLTKDIIYASKQFRILSEMGYKKDDIENALRNSNMNLEDALFELKALSVRDANNLDSDNVGRFKGSALNSNTPSPCLLSNTATGLSANPSLTSITNRNPLMSILQQQQPQQQHQPQSVTSPQSNSQANQVQSALSSANQQSTRIAGSAQHPKQNQLRIMVQQIQLAVQAGHLNAQILNQPLAPTTLHLLYQLLQQIKNLHQLQQITQTPHLNKQASNLQPSINVQITQTKQNLMNLQNQIAAQQAIFLKQQQQKQQQQQQNMTPAGLVNSGTSQSSSNINPSQTTNNDFFKSSDNSFVVSGERDSQNVLSRFQTTWKTPFTKEDEINLAVAASLQEFSRAPGSASKPISMTPGLSSRNDTINWTGLTNEDTSGWPDVTGNTLTNIGGQNNDLKDMSVTTANSIVSSVQSPYNLNDLVPEFEPGKPWKGTSNLKNIEDDPTITPGSITRSPLSVNTIKDPLVQFNWPSKLSPGASNTTTESLTSLPLSSSTWAFTPTANLYNNNAETKPNNVKSGGWSSMNAEGTINACGDNLWGNSVSKSRGPPPGLAPQIKSPATTNANNSNSSNIWNTENRNSGSAFLLLRNLTPQIDGSTLKTLCVQHGPLQLFHLFLNHGIALARYSTREEAAKAQSALNNCVLGNTTILADMPQEAEVQQYLQLISGGQHSSTLNWSSNGQNCSSNGVVQSSTASFRNSNSALQYNSGNTNCAATKPIDSNNGSPNWNTQGLNLWSFSSTGNNLWSAPAINAQDRSTPSSIQSLLPGDLLGGETN